MPNRQIADAGAFAEGTQVSDLLGTPSRWLAIPSRRAMIAARGLLGVICVTALLGFWHLDRYPSAWFDEGNYLLVAQSLAEHGRYVPEAPDGTRDFGPVISVGPAVMLPAATVQFVWGSSLWASRALVAGWMVLATAAIYVFSRRLFGERSALFTIAIVLTMPALAWITTGRQLLGEVPAAFLLVAGTSVAFRGRSLAGGAFAGLILGLAMITKTQFLLVLPLSICIVALIDWSTARVRPLRWYALLLATALASYIAWFVTLLSMVGDGNLIENYRLLRELSGGVLLVFDLERMRAAWIILLGPRSLFLVPMASLYGLLLTLRTRSAERRLALASLLVFQTVWFAWFAIASIGWPRYAFFGLLTNSLFAGAMLSGLFGALPKWRSVREVFEDRRGAVAAVLMLAVLALMLAGSYRELAPIFREDLRGPQVFSSAVDQALPAGTVVDGWEPEIDFLSRTAMQNPPLGTLDLVQRVKWLNSTEDVDLSATLSADYLIVGHFARWVGIYDAALASGDYELVFSQDGYELYERVGAR